MSDRPPTLVARESSVRTDTLISASLRTSGASADVLVSSAIRSHFRRSAASGRSALLSKHILLGSQSELALAPALHPDSVKLERRPRGTIWYLSAQAGYWNPFERARVSHLIPKEGEGIKLGGAVTKRKREEAAAAAAAAAAGLSQQPGSTSQGGGGIKIRLKMSSAATRDEEDDDDEENDPLLLDGTMGAIGDDVSSHSRSLGSSSSGNDPRLGPGRRQRGPTDGFPNFARTDSQSDDDGQDDPTPTSSLPNPRQSHLGHRPRFVPPKRLQARQSMPNPALDRFSPQGRAPHYRGHPVGDDSDSSSSSEDDDFHEAMLRSDDFAFGMDDMDTARSGEDSGDTPATTPRDGATDGLSDQQQADGAAKTVSTSPPPRRPTLPPVPTPAELLAGGPVPISADPNGHAAMDLTTESAFSSPEHADPHLLRHRHRTAPHSPAQPYNSSTMGQEPPHSVPPAGLLALPRMQADSPSPSPAVSSIVLPHLHGLPSFIAHSSPSRHTFHSHPHLTSGVGSTPNSPSTETKEQEEAFNLTLSLLPRDFKPISLRDRFGASRSCAMGTDDHFDEDGSICVVHADDGSPRSDASGLFDDFGPLGARETSLATSEEDHALGLAERWAMRTTVKVEPSSPQMVSDEDPLSPTMDEHPHPRASSSEAEVDQTAASACRTDHPEDATMSDEDDPADDTELFLGPESVGLDELERAWGSRRGGERRSPLSASDLGSDGVSVPTHAEDAVGEDVRMEALDEVRRSKEAFARALVDKVRAATALRLGSQSDESDDDLESGSTALTRVSSCSTLRQQPAHSSTDPTGSATATAAPPKKKRRSSLLPKPLLAPVRHEYSRRRAETSPSLAHFDEMDLLSTESGLVSTDASTSSSIEDHLNSDLELVVDLPTQDPAIAPEDGQMKRKMTPKLRAALRARTKSPNKLGAPSSPEAPTSLPRSAAKPSARATTVPKSSRTELGSPKTAAASRTPTRPKHSTSTASSPMTDVDDEDEVASAPMAIPSTPAGRTRTTRRTSKVTGGR